MVNGVDKIVVDKIVVMESGMMVSVEPPGIFARLPVKNGDG
jgi:hypothetical protein